MNVDFLYMCNFVSPQNTVYCSLFFPRPACDDDNHCFFEEVVQFQKELAPELVALIFIGCVTKPLDITPAEWYQIKHQIWSFGHHIIIFWQNLHKHSAMQSNMIIGPRLNISIDHLTGLEKSASSALATVLATVICNVEIQLFRVPNNSRRNWNIFSLQFLFPERYSLLIFLSCQGTQQVQTSENNSPISKSPTLSRISPASHAHQKPIQNTESW